MDCVINKCVCVFQATDKGIETTVGKCVGDSIYNITRRGVSWNGSHLIDIEYVSEAKAISRGYITPTQPSSQ